MTSVDRVDHGTAARHTRRQSGQAAAGSRVEQGGAEWSIFARGALGRHDDSAATHNALHDMDIAACGLTKLPKRSRHQWPGGSGWRWWRVQTLLTWCPGEGWPCHTPARFHGTDAAAAAAIMPAIMPNIPGIHFETRPRYKVVGCAYYSTQL